MPNAFFNKKLPMFIRNNMKKEIFGGVGTALVTPFKNGKVDYLSLEIMINRQIEAGVGAIILLGTTGEPATLNESERKKILIEAKKIISGKTKMIVGCGSNCTLKAVELCKKAQDLGADGALIVTPYYNKCTQNGLIAHYEKIASKTDLPIIVYNVPSRTGVNVLPETMQKLCLVDNICGLKEASGNIANVLDFFRLCKDKISIYSGEDALNAIFLAMGASGTISVASNIFPKICVKINALAKSKEYEKMFILQQNMQLLIKALFSEVNPICVKAGLAYLGLCKNELRLPLTTIQSENFDKLKIEINKLIGQEIWLFVNLEAQALQV